MAKRLRQTSLFETAKKRCEESSSVSVDRDQESPSTDSQLDPQSGTVPDEAEPNAQIQENPFHEETEKRCEESSSVSVDRDQESPSTDSQHDPQSCIVLQDETEPNAQIQENPFHEETESE